MKKIVSLFVISILFGTSLVVNAQSLRLPTPAEKAALQKVVNALNRITNSFNDANWATADNNFDPGLFVPSGARSHCGIGYTIKLSLREGSPAYHQIMDPLLAAVNSTKPDYGKIESLRNTFEKQSAVTIDIELNGESIPFGSSPKQNKQLNVPGAAKAFIEAENDNNPDEAGAYVLAFGNWSAAKYDAENNVLRFRFRHPPQTPYIENVTIRMRGNDNKIDAIIRKADWNSLNAALAK